MTRITRIDEGHETRISRITRIDECHETRISRMTRIDEGHETRISRMTRIDEGHETRISRMTRIDEGHETRISRMTRIDEGYETRISRITRIDKGHETRISRITRIDEGHETRMTRIGPAQLSTTCATLLAFHRLALSSSGRTGIGERPFGFRRLPALILLAGALVNNPGELRPSTKVEEQAHLKATRLQVMKNLCLLICGKLRSSLDLDDNSRVDDQVGAKGDQPVTSERDRQLNLLLKRETQLLEYDDERPTKHVFRIP